MNKKKNDAKKNKRKSKITEIKEEDEESLSEISSGLIDEDNLISPEQANKELNQIRFKNLPGS